MKIKTERGRDEERICVLEYVLICDVLELSYTTVEITTRYRVEKEYHTFVLDVRTNPNFNI